MTHFLRLLLACTILSAHAFGAAIAMHMVQQAPQTACVAATALYHAIQAWRNYTAARTHAANDTGNEPYTLTTAAICKRFGIASLDQFPAARRHELPMLLDIELKLMSGEWVMQPIVAGETACVLVPASQAQRDEHGNILPRFRGTIAPSGNNANASPATPCADLSPMPCTRQTPASAPDAHDDPLSSQSHIHDQHTTPACCATASKKCAAPSHAKTVAIGKPRDPDDPPECVCACHDLRVGSMEPLCRECLNGKLRLKYHPHGVYRAKADHHPNARGHKSNGPHNRAGQRVLDGSVLRTDGKWRLGIEYSACPQFVVLLPSNDGSWHGYYRAWDKFEMSDRQRLIGSFAITAGGRILR